jgi:hypothetical protein
MSTSLVAMGEDDYGLTPYQRRKAIRETGKTELDIFLHGLDARRRAESEILDGQAVADVMQASLQEEIHLLEWGLQRASGSAAARELVARKVNMLSTINNNRIARRFGR